MRPRIHLCCPVRPSQSLSGEGRPVDDDDEEWNDPSESYLYEAPPPNQERITDGDMVDADEGVAYQKARTIPEPRRPTREEVARHNLTHLPYCSWCPHCVACRRSNVPHRQLTASDGRTLPIFVADYAFMRKPNEDLVTMLVGRLYPSRMVFATVCDVKGPDDSATDRLATFFRETGYSHIVYKSDQEPAIVSMITEALSRANRAGDGRPSDTVNQAVPEWSAVGESASNGRAERAVQQVQDMLRTYLHALESRIKRSVSCSHPIVRWMVEHVMHMLNRYTINPDGVSPYAALHGRRAAERHAEFGEKVFWHVPKRARTKMCLRWRLGTFVGVSSTSNEIYVAETSGKVIKTRSIGRVVANGRWDAKAILNITGTPGNHTAVHVHESEHEHLEEHQAPHEDADAEIRGAVDVEAEALRRRTMPLARITDRDLKKYGFHPGCPKCDILSQGKKCTWEAKHSDECRLRLYKAYKDHGDYKYKLVKEYLDSLEAQPGDRQEHPIQGEEVDLRGSAPATPISPPAEELLRNSDEPDQSGRWDPETE